MDQLNQNFRVQNGHISTPHNRINLLRAQGNQPFKISWFLNDSLLKSSFRAAISLLPYIYDFVIRSRLLFSVSTFFEIRSLDTVFVALENPLRNAFNGCMYLKDKVLHSYFLLNVLWY